MVDLLQMVMGGLMLLAVALVELVIVLAAINSRRFDGGRSRRREARWFVH